MGNLNKESTWETIKQRVDCITDALGMPIDKMIKPTVVGLMAHNFSTSASCGGHTNRVLSYPWVEIYSPAPEGWKDNKIKQEKWRRENLVQQQRMIDYLSEFYQNRRSSFNTRLCIQYIGKFGGFRIHSTGAEVASLLPHKQQLQELALYRQEMTDFADFLHTKFFLS